MTPAKSRPDPEALPPLREVIATHGLRARKSLGQHFLLDMNLTRRIVRAAGDLDGTTVFEIGPGPGGLTRALLESPARQVVAIDLDPRAIAALGDLQAWAGARLLAREGDALTMDLPDAVPETAPPWAIVANLPYNVGTPLLLHWLRRAREFRSFTLMFQKEVADRLTAAPRNKAYGRLSVVTQWLCDVTPCFNLPAAAFTPPPKVASAVVHLVPRPAPLAPARHEDLERVTAAAFGQRRKMLRQSLKQLGPRPEDLCARAGVAPTARAEELSVAEFAALAREVEAGK